MCIRFPFHWAIKCFPPKRDIKGIFSESQSTRFFRIQQFRSGQGPSITISIYLAVDYKGNETRHVGGWSWIICAQVEVANKFLGTKLKKDEQHPASGLRCNKQVIWDWDFKLRFCNRIRLPALTLRPLLNCSAIRKKVLRIQIGKHLPIRCSTRDPAIEIGCDQ